MESGFKIQKDDATFQQNQYQRFYSPTLKQIITSKVDEILRRGRNRGEKEQKKRKEKRTN